MDINRNNYEAYLLDLMEGRLSALESQQVRDFLRLNPDYAEGMNDENTWCLDSDAIVFEEKNRLKKEFPDHSTSLNSSNFDMFSIARLEGDLSPGQEADHELLVTHNSEMKKEWGSWRQTKLVAETILYNGKEKLVKTTGHRNRVIWISVISAAAAVAMIITLIRVPPDLTDPTSAGSETIVESLDEAASLENSGEAGLSDQKEPVVSPVILASDPVSLSIKKHQDPPELTGRDQVPAKSVLKADSTSRTIQEDKIQASPLKLGMFQAYQESIVEAGFYDLITELDILPPSPQTGSVTLAQLSEKGLRQTYKEFVEEKDISLLTIASAGVDGINRLTGSDLSLNLSRDEGGKVSGFRFRSNRHVGSFPRGQSRLVLRACNFFLWCCL